MGRQQAPLVTFSLCPWSEGSGRGHWLSPASPVTLLAFRMLICSSYTVSLFFSRKPSERYSTWPQGKHTGVRAAAWSLPGAVLSGPHPGRGSPQQLPLKRQTKAWPGPARRERACLLWKTNCSPKEFLSREDLLLGGVNAVVSHPPDLLNQSLRLNEMAGSSVHMGPERHWVSAHGTDVYGEKPSVSTSPGKAAARFPVHLSLKLQEGWRGLC